MLGSMILDIAIGLSLIYFFFALVASGITEWLAKVLDKRAKHLRGAILNLLQEDNKLVDELYKNPLMSALYKEKKNLNGAKPTPSYIPSDLFATALINTLNPNHAKTTIDELRESITTSALINDKLKQGLLALIDRAGGDIEQAYKNIEDWFNDSMDRLSGWYKKHTQNVLLVISIAVVLIANVDTLKLANAIQQDPVLRAGMVAAAEETVQQYGNASPAVIPSAASISAKIEPLNLPVGFTEYMKEMETYNKYLNSPDIKSKAKRIAENNNSSEASAMSWIGCETAFIGVITKFTGLLITILAVQMGAPFWFDMLNKLVNVRNAGKKPESSNK